jgi:abortive infection bacteriophage resistance protein
MNIEESQNYIHSIKTKEKIVKNICEHLVSIINKNINVGWWIFTPTIEYSIDVRENDQFIVTILNTNDNFQTCHTIFFIEFHNSNLIFKINSGQLSEDDITKYVITRFYPLISKNL